MSGQRVPPMKRPAGGWLLIVGGVGMGLVLWLTPSAGATSRDADEMARHDFDGLVRSVSQRYKMHAQSIPMMWLANICARSATHGGVGGMKVVEFEDAGRIQEDAPDTPAFAGLLQERLAARWSPLVRTQQAGADSFVYAHHDEDGKHTRLIVIDLDGGELDLVTVSLDPDQLAKWTWERDRSRT